MNGLAMNQMHQAGQQFPPSIGGSAPGAGGFQDEPEALLALRLSLLSHNPHAMMGGENGSNGPQPFDGALNNGESNNNA